MRCSLKQEYSKRNYPKYLLNKFFYTADMKSFTILSNNVNGKTVFVTLWSTILFQPLKNMLNVVLFLVVNLLVIKTNICTNWTYCTKDEYCLFGCVNMCVSKLRFSTFSYVISQAQLPPKVPKPGLGIRWFAQIAQIKWATVSDSLRTFEWLWANRSGRSCQKSNREQIAQVAHDKKANRLFFLSQSLIGSFTHKIRAIRSETDERIANPAPKQVNFRRSWQKLRVEIELCANN